MKLFGKKSAWVLVSTYLTAWAVISVVAGNVLEGFKKNINTALGLSGTRTEIIETDDEEQDLEYFKSDYVKKDGSGNPKYVTEPSGYTHEEYDDAALRAATEAKAEQVQAEGSVLLWNSTTNGLPIAKGKKVSVFSHSSVDWAESGGGSGVSQTNPNSTIYNELTSAGLEVNQTLWNFYKSGAGSSYTRTGNVGINEVPWSVYTNDVKNSFSTYKDAAILIFTRVTREASTGGNGGDATKSQADTATGDYFDLSQEEEDMLTNVIQLKKSGTFSKVIVLLNTPTGMFMDSFVKNKNDIDSVLWVGQTGYQGLHAVGKLLVGDLIPSGRLPDTFAFNTQSAPSTVNIEGKYYANANDYTWRSKSQQAAYLTYAEGIYVGYRYYETRYEDAVLNQGNATSLAGVKNSTSTWKYSEEVAFPFGHGASYTTFELSNYSCVKNESGNYDVTVTVRNTGSNKGYDVVEVYAQRPYTQYDKDNNIEQPAVSLVGYAKTRLLSAGETQTLNIEVRDDSFKTYDANNKKTYIREKTSGIDAYYIAAAHDAHEGINNILAAKGKTPMNTSNKMDATGDASLVQKFDFDDDDFVTYSVSEYTGKEITNEFDDVDWNKYQNTNDITYLSRKDWNATYPVQTASLSLTADVVADLADTHAVPSNPEDQMPKYGQTPLYNLIDMKDVPYDDPRWDTIVDQLTQDEQIKLLGSAYFGTGSIASISKPAESAADGPLGLKKSMTGDSSIKTMSYPSPTILAASFNDQLAYDVGELMAEDGLHSGTTGLYAPGVNTHRSTYGARNWEYHSEDGFLAGMIGKWRVIGSQSKGCYVHMKHFALNDQESFRHGVNVWANEQSIREIYLNAYEYAVTEGHCTGMMTAFVRFGTHWSGAHWGLCTGVLRNEWGFEGMVLSDSAWQQYMGVVDGVLAGNDTILYNVDLSMYDVAKTNATVAKAIRESTHRVLYVVSHSNAMNGFSSNVRVYEVREWWQRLVSNIQKILIGIAIALAVFTIVRFIFDSPIKKERELNKALTNKPKEIAKQEEKKNPKIKAIKKKRGFTWAYLATNAVVLGIACAVTASTCEPLFVPEPDPLAPQSMRDKIDGPAEIYKLEAEDSLVDTNISQFGKGYEGKTPEQTNNPSGTGFIYNVNKTGDATFTFVFEATEAKKAVLGTCFGRREFAININAMYSITVNGKNASYRELNVDIPEMENSEYQYYDWYESDIMLVNIKSGLNSIVLTKVKDAPKILNLDYLYLYSPVEVTPAVGEYKNYKFDCNETQDPFLEKYGGSVVDSDKTYKIEGDEGLYRYGNGNGAVLTAVFIAEQPTVAIIKLISDCRPGRTFSFSSAATSGENPYISAFSVNGEITGFIGSNKTYPSDGWNKYRQCELAIIKLQEGENVISLTIAGDNINYTGIAFDSLAKIKLRDVAETYRFDVNQSSDPSNEQNEMNPFIPANGGNRVDNDGSYNTETSNIYKYGSGNNATLTTTLVVDEATSVVYSLINDCRPGKVFSATQNESNPYIQSMTLNGDTTGVTMSDKTYASQGWNVLMDCELATLELQAGENVIIFQIGGDNINYAGISVDSFVPVRLKNMPIDYVFDVNDSSDPSNEQNELNPFIPENGGSREDSDGSYATESYDLYRYGAGNGAKLSTTIVVDKAVTVTYMLINDCRPGKSFNATQVQSGYPYIKNITLNDSLTGVTKANQSYESQGWNVFMHCELATLELSAGANTVKFEIGGDNINYCGIVVSSPTPVSLRQGVKTYRYDVNNAEDPTSEENPNNPFIAFNNGSIEDTDTTFKTEGSAGLYRYGNANNAIVTVTLKADANGTAIFKIIGDCRPSQGEGYDASVFSYTQQTKTNKNNNPFIQSMTVNGLASAVTPSTRTYTSQGWNQYMDMELAEVNLTSGVNTIVFQIGGDNINLCGIVVDSTLNITLGNK